MPTTTITSSWAAHQPANSTAVRIAAGWTRFRLCVDQHGQLASSPRGKTPRRPQCSVSTHRCDQSSVKQNTPRRAGSWCPSVGGEWRTRGVEHVEVGIVCGAFRECLGGGPGGLEANFLSTR